METNDQSETPNHPDKSANKMIDTQSVFDNFFTNLLPNFLLRRACLQTFLESIREADRYGSDKWGVYYRHDLKKARLVVGNIIVCTLCEEGVWLALDRVFLDTHPELQGILNESRGWIWDTICYPQYNSPPSRNGYYDPIISPNEIRALIKQGHFEYIKSVCHRYRSLNIRVQNKLNNDLLLYIARELNDFVPRPDYGGEACAPAAIEAIRLTEPILSEVPETERTALVQSRIGQGRFRQHLLQYWGGCSVTGCEETSLLRASHIKPWSTSTNSERLDVFNGFLLTPNLDAAFDRGLISFRNDGQILICNHLLESDANHLGINTNLKLRWVHDRHMDYLNHHRTTEFGLKVESRHPQIIT